MIGGAVALGRRYAEARMTQTWRIGPTSEVTDSSLDTVTVFTEEVYNGPARLRISSASVGEGAPASQMAVSQTLELHLPASVSGVEVDMRAVCDACPEDPSLVGRVVRIKGLPSAGQVTAARFPVEESGERIPEVL